MIVDETYIGEYQREDYRAKGLILEAETELDAKIINFYLENKKYFRNLCESEYLKKLKDEKDA